MTKEQLIKDRNEWKQQAESLQDDYDSLSEAYYDLECKLEDKVQEYENDHKVIKNVENFKWRLKVDGLWKEDLERFIDDYMRWYND